jgi:lipid II:glycine glycyltransferase (peptidoglycan interpeptide bridge formation enzyme)
MDAAYQVEVDRISRDEWEQVLPAFADANLYQAWTYGAVRWGEKSLSHLVIRALGEVKALVQLRIVRPRLLKCGIAYVRWGPLYQRRGQAPDPEFARTVFTAIYDEYVRKRRLFLRIMPDAIAGSEREREFKDAQFTWRRPAHSSVERTITLDITPPIEQLRKALDQKWRNQLNRAEKNGLRMVQGHGPEEYAHFRQLYQEMWNRKKFETTVDVDEFSRIAAELPIHLKLTTFICYNEGKPVGSTICSSLGSTGVYLLGATNEDGMKCKAAYLLQWSMIQHLKERGVQFYDLGGIDPEKNPGVYHFKKGLSGAEVQRSAPFEACLSPLSAACTFAGDYTRSFSQRLRRIQIPFYHSAQAANPP